MIYLEKPKDFNSKFDIVSCFFEHDGKILLLHRQDYKPQGNTWGVPAGKVEIGEKPLDAIIRELEEETGYAATQSELKLNSRLFIKSPEYDFIYYIFSLSIKDDYSVKIDSKGHKNFEWVTPRKALDKNLIHELDLCIKLNYSI